MGFLTPVPGQTNNGIIKSSSEIDVSVTIWRRIGFLLSLLRRVTGNDIILIFHVTIIIQNFISQTFIS